MKIALVCSHGGHLTETLFLMEAFKEHDVFFITYDNFRTRNLQYKTYLLENLLENLEKNPIKVIRDVIRMTIILAKERPDVIVSTGAEIAIPAFIIAKFLGIRTIFIESWCRIKTKSGTGRIVYYLSDLFLVQWPQLLKLYGKRAKYVGAVV
ncbi:PssD/Cps14F family polysaccharide biosynthesis glycosyltransferase [Thermococcus sibiricus]|uniref:Capsular polysaccharide biosynthesis protein n=1 Tax=Thermococcus sibiricus TaxID=172049 RepID=A0A124FF78_9EURY|nr:PssD/Cps14F family polysaccharide biosynthesis glycosyltransferase [Thermococcus sibiricus]KUK17271.1 MAG: Capsular polysaccharide biosynthesis protein [Thermococcus sibiricus]